MAGEAQKLLGQLLRLTEQATSDAALVARWAQQKDEDAFATLVARHGPMVLGVCRRVLRDRQHAEDAFQATFLVLARKAATLRPPEAVSMYLYGVAQRIARKARTARRCNTAAAPPEYGEAPDPRPDPLDAVSGRELLAMVDAEVARLPEVYRLPVLLCVLQERSVEEAARILGWTPGSVRGRLARGRQRLRERLARRGLASSGGAIALLAPGKVPPHLVATSLRNLTSAAPATVNTLAAGVNLALGFKALCVVLVLAAVGVGTGLSLVHAPEAPSIMAAAPPAPNKEKPRRDAYGDPLPENALARLGTLRMRHGEPIFLLSFAPDGKTLLSADSHGIHAWDAMTGKLLRRFGDPHGRQYQSISVSRDNRIAALTMSEGAIEMWDANTGQPLRQFQAGRFPGVELSPDGTLLAVCEYENGRRKEVQSLRILDALTGAERHRLIGHQDTIHSVLFSKDGKMLVTSSDDKSIRFWDVAAGKQVRRFDYAAPVGSIALSPDGKTMASVGEKKIVWKRGNGISTTWIPVCDIVVWDVATGKERQRLVASKNDANAIQYPGGVNALFFTPDSKVLLSSDWTTHWWDVATGKEMPRTRLPLGRAYLFALSPDGRTLVSSMGHSIQLWDWNTGKQRPVGIGHQEAIGTVAISPDGRTFATGGENIRLWNISGEEKLEFPGHSNWVHSLAFVPSGRLLISAGQDQSVRIGEVAPGKLVRTLPGSEATVSPDGMIVATTDNKDKCIHIWDLATGRELRKWASEGSMVRAFSHDGRIVMGSDEKSKVHVWEVATAKELLQFGHRFPASARPPVATEDWMDSVYCLAFSPDGKLVAFGGQANAIAIYDTMTGKEIKLLAGTPGPVVVATFSPDNRMLAFGGWSDGVVHLWEMATGQEIQKFAGHRGRVHCMSFSADGKLLLTGSEDTTALAWNVTGRPMLSLVGRLSEDDLNVCWADLAGTDATQAFRARGTLVSFPSQALGVLQKRLQPIEEPGAKKLARLLSDLDSPEFTTRAQAQADLEKLAEAAEPALRQTLKNNPTLEVRQRVQRLLDRLQRPIPPPDVLRGLRALAVLEDIGTPPARKLLETLASGALAARLTREAQASLERLQRRAGTYRGN